MRRPRRVTVGIPYWSSRWGQAGWSSHSTTVRRGKGCGLYTKIGWPSSKSDASPAASAKKARVWTRLAERERILSTGIGGGVAVPHAQIPGLGRLTMAASTHPSGIEYPSLDEGPVRIVFCLLGDANTAADHLAGLARLARLARRSADLEPLVTASDGAAP